MSSTSIELFRQHTEKQRQQSQEPQCTAAKAQAEEPKKPMVAEISRIEHEVREVFDDASPAERDNIIRFLEVLLRNLKRHARNSSNRSINANDIVSEKDLTDGVKTYAAWLARAGVKTS